MCHNAPMPNNSEQPEVMGSGYIQARQFASILEVNVETVRRRLRAKLLHGLRVGPNWRIPHSELKRVHKEGGI